MKKVVEVVGSLAVGGAERIALEIAAGLAERHARDWRTEIWVLAPDEIGATSIERPIQAEAERRAVAVRLLSFVSLRDPATRARVRVALREQAVDLIHVHNRPQDWQMAILGRAMGVPVVYTVHSSYPHKRLSTRLLYAAIARIVPRVVCVSQAVARHIQTVELVDPGKIRMIYNGIHMGIYGPPSAERRAVKRAQLGWGDDQFVWLCAARLSPPKGLQYLLEAIARLPRSSRAMLVLAGDGSEGAALKAQAAKRALGPRVIFLGSRSDVAELMGAADGYACSSLREGHPLSLLEAMACELPVVAPRLPPIEEIACGPGMPTFFGPRVEGSATSHDPHLLAETLLSVEKDPQRGRARGPSVRAQVGARFSLELMIDRHAELYAEIVGLAGASADQGGGFTHRTPGGVSAPISP